MPLYDCLLLIKPHIKKEAIIDLLARIGKHVNSRNGVLTEIRSEGTVHLGYGIKKLDGKYHQGQLMQMTMMATPNMNKELHYLNKEDRLLRWLLVKHRDTRLDFFTKPDLFNKPDFFNRDGLSRFDNNPNRVDIGVRESLSKNDDSSDDEEYVGFEANEDQSK